MDRWRAAGALLALAACFACSAAAPTASNHTALDLYDANAEGCYYNFQHYGEGDRIMTNEPCLNCTCHNRMLMCYLRVCPFTKPIGQDCTVEKRADQCCPIITCPDVPVDLLTSTSTSSPAEYGATGLGKLDKYGCSINGKYFPEGSKVPPTPNKPCEHCYCIRNMTTCVMQECTLHVDGCMPIYHKDVCCPVRYSCDHPEDEMPMLDDMSTTVRPTPGFLLTTTTVSPVTQMTQDCVHNDEVIADGAIITTDKACEHCYCMKGDIVCVVQECGAPMENEGKNCTSMPPREGQCCPDTYICEGDELSTEIVIESTTDSMLEKLTTLSPPRRAGIEGSGYRHEPSEGENTEMPSTETELEGSGEEEEPTKATDTYEPLLPGKPVEPERITPSLEDGEQYIPVTSKSPVYEVPETTTNEIDRNYVTDKNVEKETIEPQSYLPTTHATVQEPEDKIMAGVTEDDNLKLHEHVAVTVASTPESYEKVTTESGESLSTVSGILPVQEHDKPYEQASITTSVPILEESGTTIFEDMEGVKGTISGSEPSITQSGISEEIPVSEYVTPSSMMPEDSEKETTDKTDVTSQHIPVKESSSTESYIDSTTADPVVEEKETDAPKESEEITDAENLKDKESAKPGKYFPSTTSIPTEEIGKFTTEPDHAQNTVAVAEEGYTYPHPPSSGELEKTPTADLGDTITEKITEDESLGHHDASTQVSVSEETEVFTVEPDKSLNTIPSEIDEESLIDKTTLSVADKPTEPSVMTHAMEPQDVDIKSSTSEPVTSSDIHITKADQYTITTEPSFRREDEIRVTTEKESMATTIKSEFIDEGLIPTSTHDEKPSTGADVATIDEDITTILPEYSQGFEETSDSHHPTTESFIATSADSVTVSEKITEAVTVSEKETASPSSTEKSTDISMLEPDEEPSRIPGEGDCLLNGVTYRNNTVVPSTNNCHTGCKCVSSIIKCDPIICSPPPDYMDNCQSIYDTPDSCCPTYVCDHPKETIPPQSDNQMSGTEPPMPPPVIECRGDQCELSEPTKPPTETSEPCTGNECLHPAEHKPETTDCGPEGCAGVDKELQHPGEESSCTDGKCEPASESCTQGECKLPETPSEVPAIKPCEGNDCKASGEEVASPQPCENESDCKPQNIPLIEAAPCEGDLCTKVDCGSSGCAPEVALPPQDKQQVPCKEEDGCKPQEIVPSECTGDTPCRRKEVSTDELPPKCEGDGCMPKTDKVEEDTQKIDQFSTPSSLPEQTPSEETPEKVTYTEDKLSEPTESQFTGFEKEETTPASQFVTEKEYVPTEHTVYETTEQEIKTDEVTQKGLADITTEEPSVIEQEATSKPAFPESEETDKTIEDQATAIPVVTQEDVDTPSVITEEKQTHEIKPTETPHIIADEYTSKPNLVEEEEHTKPPVPYVDEQTAKPALVDDEGTKMPDVVVDEETSKPSLEEGPKVTEIAEGYTDEPALVEETATKAPGVLIEEQTSKPEIVEGIDTRIQEDAEEKTGKPAMVEEALEEQTDKPSLIEEKDEMKPDTIDDDHTHKLVPSEEEDKKVTDITEGYTNEPTMVDETGTTKPDVVKEEQTSKPALTEDKETDIIVDEQTERLIPIEQASTKVPDNAEGYTDEPILTVDTETRVPDIDGEKQSEKPTLVEEEDKKTTDLIVEKQTDMPVVNEEETIKPDVSEEATMVPDLTEEKQTSKPDMAEEIDTKIPTNVEEDHTDKLVPSIDEGIKIMDVSEGSTDDPAGVKETSTTLHVVDVVEQTEKPTLVEGVDKQVPDHEVEEETSKPEPFEVEGTTTSSVIVEDQTDKPVSVEEEGTKIPEVVVQDHTDKSVLTPEDATTVIDDKKALEEEHGSTKPDISEEERTEKPLLAEDVSTDLESASTKKPDLSEEYTEKPISAEDETTVISDLVTETQDIVKVKPTSVEQDLPEKPTVIKEDTEKKPGLLEEENITDHPTLGEEGTEMPETTEVSDTKKPMLIDESTLAPAEIESVTETKSPTAIEQERTDKPESTGDKTEGTTFTVEAITKEPGVLETSPDQDKMDVPKPSEGHTYLPPPPEHEDTRRTEPKKDVYLPDTSIEEHTPIYESQTISTEEKLTTESHLESVDQKEPDESSEPLESSSLMPEEKTTLVPPSETTLGETSPSKGEDLLPERVTLPQEPLTNAHEASKAPEYAVTTEYIDKTTKSAENEIISEQGETYTDMPEQDSLVTKLPEDIIIEPQDGESSTTTSVTMKVPVDEEKATAGTPESGEYDSTSAPEQAIPKVTDIPEVINADAEKTEVTKPQDVETEKTPIMLEEDEKEIKTTKPEIFTPEKEEMITSTVVSGVTEPVKDFTEIEDVSFTGEVTTEYNVSPVDSLKPSATERTDESSETLSSSSETPLLGTLPEESFTESHEIYTEAPILRETQSADVPYKPEISTVLSVDVPTITESPQLSGKPLEQGKPITEQDFSSGSPESETKMPDISALGETELPVIVETESQDKPTVPVDDTSSQDEKSTTSPYVETSTVPEIYVSGEPVATDAPESHISASEDTKPSKPTDSSYVEEHTTEAQVSDKISEDHVPTDTYKTTAIPEITSEQIGTKATESSHTESEDEHPTEAHKLSTEYPTTYEESHTDVSQGQAATEPFLSLITEQQPATGLGEESTTEKHVTETSLQTESQDRVTEKSEVSTLMSEVTVSKEIEEVSKPADITPAQAEFSETTPYLIELEEHTHKIVEDISTTFPTEEEDHTYKAVEDIETPSPIGDDHAYRRTTSSLSEDDITSKTKEPLSTTLPSVDHTHKTDEDKLQPTGEFTTRKPYSPETVTDKIMEEGIEITTKQVSGERDELSTIAAVDYQTTLSPTASEDTSDKLSESSGLTEPAHTAEITAKPSTIYDKYDSEQQEVTTDKSIQELDLTSPSIIATEKSPIAESAINEPTEKETPVTQKTTVPEGELILSTTKATTIKEEDILTTAYEDKYGKPEEKPTSEIIPPSTTAEIPKPPTEMQPTDEVSPPEDDGHFPPSGTGYGEPDYVEEDQAFGPGTCRYGGKVYVSAQQIPRDDPCDFCFCFRSDIICLQQSCPPPIHGCHEEPIQGFCCPRYECPVSMATTVNVTTTTTTTTTTLPPHFPTHSYKGAAQRRGCQIKGHTYKVGEVVRSSSGPCLHCTCGGDGQMKCDPKACTPEPMLRQMIAAAVSAKRRR